MADPANAATAKPLQDQRILITGATGFIGGPTVSRLQTAGAVVHGLARTSRPHTTTGAAISWHLADLTDRDQTRAAIEACQPDQIVHLASMVAGDRDPGRIVEMFNANTASSVHLLDAALACGVKRVHLAGSLEEPAEGELSASPYALSKAASHLYGDYYNLTTDLEVVNLQIFMVYGPAQRDTNKLVPSVINSLLQGQSPSIGPGTRPVDWVYVDDVAEAVVRCCVAQQAPERPVPVGTGELHTVRQVVELLEKLVEGSPPAHFGALDQRVREVVRVADVDQATALLGWHPQVSLREGLRRTVAWHRQAANRGSPLSSAKP